jgi:hypothetical protein
VLRPDGRNVKAGLLWDNAHVFVYRWGVTLRYRQGDGWRHWTARMRTGRHQANRAVHAIVGVETWRTAEGTTGRVPLSKRYVNFKVLL